MIPATGDKPQHNGLELNPEMAPSTSSGIAQDNSHYSNHQCDDQNVIIDLVAQIDPPEGFEPTPESHVSNNQARNSKSNVNIDSSRTSSSSRGSSSSSLEDPNVFFQLNQPIAAGSSRAGDMIEDINTQTTISSDYTTTQINGSQQNSQQTVSTISHNSQNGDDTDDNEMIEAEPKPSTSSSNSTYPRLVNGFSNIVTRITKAFANTSLSMINTDRCLQDDVPKFAFGHTRSVEKTWKSMLKVVKCCQRPGMNLNNSPPFILEILPETYQHLKLIHTKYDSSSKYPANDNEYSQIFLQNLQTRCKQTLKLFKDAKEEMFNEDSEYRHKLTRHTLVFNHILSELKAIFPNGKFIGEKYLITKKEGAGEFWKNNFGSSVLVDWRTFYHALQLVHNIDSSFFSLNALKQTIDLTCDEYISIFEFDVFTRLFQPWTTLLRNWQILAVTHPGYKAFLTYDELKARLQKHIDKPGSYVFRLSCTRLGQWAIGYVTHDRQILQTIVQNISLSQALTETKFYLYPDGKDEDPSLNVLCSGMAGNERNVTVTEEQYEIYCGVGNSFQTCKICFENDKDIRVEPCNHLLCTSCLIAWQESEGQGCPYCRTEIKETVQITMDLPRSRNK